MNETSANQTDSKMRVSKTKCTADNTLYFKGSDRLTAWAKAGEGLWGARKPPPQLNEV